ncbi:nucleotide exchange factor GrpE [Stappia stellulata]|uniref:nucleotide exchange factor GrpE n=1 Tax=Stappia stellulata TaxID=71235 RepID=UPI0004047E49|nr:nucleotide exchange factor GrpE [Stappia stellulata]
MSDTSKNPNDTPEDIAAAEARAHEAHANADGGVENEAEGDRVEALQSENAEMKDRVLRTMAEMENLRRRTEKEIRESRQYAVANFARDMLGVGDNLRRALDAVSEDARESADEAMRVLIEGVELTEREMLNQLDKHGVKKLEPEGERFDPNFHQAMFEVPNTEVPNNTVVQVVQAGYMIGDRVLRPAMVGVSKGGPKERRSDAPQGEPGATVDKTA